MEECIEKNMEQCVRGFEKLIAKISSSLITVKYSDIDSCIQLSLKTLAEYVEVDRGYIFIFSEDKSLITNTHRWCSKGVTPYIGELQNIPIDMFPWFKKKILDCQTVEVFDVRLMDDSIDVKREWLRENIKSIICVPMICNEVLVGFIKFDAMVQTMRWSQDIIELLKISGGIFASAIVRQQTERKLHDSEKMMRIVLDTIPSRVFWKDNNSIYTGCNKAFARDTGFNSPEEIVGKTDYDFVWNVEQAEFYRQCDRRVMSNDAAEFDIIQPQRRADGVTASIKTNKIPLHDNLGNVVGVVGSYADITEGKKAQDELQRAKFCIDHFSDAVFWVDKDGAFFDVNGAACQTLGYSRQELLKLSVMDVTPAVTRDSWQMIWEKTKTKRTEVVEQVHVRKDGTDFPIEVLATFFEFGKMEFILAFIRDISERKAAQEELYRSKFCIDYAVDSIYWIDGDAKFIYVNETACKKLGYSKQELMQMSLLDVDPKASLEHWRKFYSDVKKIGDLFPRFKTNHKTKSGKLIPVEISSKFFEFQDTDFLVAFVSDITEQKKTEEAIQNLHFSASSKIGESCINALIENLGNILGADCLFVGEINNKPDPVIQAKYVYMNGRMVDGFEYGIQGCPCEQVVDSDIVCHPAGVKGIFPGCPVPDGMHIEGYIGVPLFNSKKEAIGIQSVIFSEPIEDVEFAKMIITLFAGRIESELERLQIEKERESLLHILKAKTDELESIVYVSSHDLRTPLISIQGFSGELEKSIVKMQDYINTAEISDAARSSLVSQIEEDFNLSLGFITKSAYKMDLLLKGLLKLSRIGKSGMEIERLDMNIVIKDVLDAMRYQIDDSDVLVVLNELPNCMADRNQIDQLFSNLIDNAVKYLRPERRGVITISGYVDDDVSVYCVEDNGLGISEDYFENIFDIFHRLNPGSRIKGEGLGLTIVKRIAARHQGKVWVESEQDSGSKFYVSLPKG